MSMQATIGPTPKISVSVVRRRLHRGADPLPRVAATTIVEAVDLGDELECLAVPLNCRHVVRLDPVEQ